MIENICFQLAGTGNITLLEIPRGGNNSPGVEALTFEEKARRIGRKKKKCAVLISVGSRALRVISAPWK